MKPSFASTAVILRAALLFGCAGTQFTRVAHGVVTEVEFTESGTR